jgi:multimeric flavodoxin WrbA
MVEVRILLPYFYTPGGSPLKVIGFVASPRKQGNTDMLVDRFLEGARSKAANTEKIYLYECTINPCQGCYRNCWLGPGDCVRFRDDMDRFIPTMIASDLLLFASPVYMASYSSQLSVFFERCIPVHHVDLERKIIVGNRLKGKNAVMALVHDSPNPATADLPFRALEHTLQNNFQMNIVGKLHVPGVRDKGDIAHKPECLREAFLLAEKLCYQP